MSRQSLIREIKICIIKQLKYKRNKSSQITGKVGITENFAKILKQQYDLTGSYKPCHDFLADFEIETTNYENEIRYVKLRQESFKMKIVKTSDLVYRPENTLSVKRIKRKPRLFFSFEIDVEIDFEKKAQMEKLYQ